MKDKPKVSLEKRSFIDSVRYDSISLTPFILSDITRLLLLDESQDAEKLSQTRKRLLTEFGQEMAAEKFPVSVRIIFL